MRVARACEGKAGAYRVLLYYRSGERTFFVYGFAKSNRSNIRGKELDELKALAKRMLSYTDKELEVLIEARELTEITEGRKE